MTIYWEPSPTETVVGYVIQEQIINEYGFPQSTPIDTVYITSYPYSHTFEYSKVQNGPVKFNILAIDGNDVPSILTDPSHSAPFLKSSYDSCNSRIVLEWTPYVGWASLTGYKVFQLGQNYDIQLLGEVSQSVNRFEVPNITENKEYCFYITALRNDGTSSFSNKICPQITTPLPPSFIVGNHTQYSGNNQLNLQFSVDPATTRDSYRLYRSEASVDNYTKVADLTKSSNGTINYTDALPSSKVYNYKLQFINYCFAEVEGVHSVPINNMLLKNRSEANTNHLSWNNFLSWAEGTKEVNLYRSTSAGNFELYKALSPSQTEYADAINAESQVKGDICYRVEAVSGNEKDTSKSNVFCVNMLGEIFVPTAFTPNDDGTNDEIRPTFSILPSKYTFSVYNRYGGKIFETNNISEGWDGRLPDGKKALEGTYIYFVKIENGAGKVLEKRGNFSVIYP